MRISDWSSDVCSSDLHDQVADAKNALNWLTEQPGVDPLRVGVIGHSFGSAVACYAGAVEQRFAFVISSCGWGRSEEHTTELQSLMRISYAVFCLKKQDWQVCSHDRPGLYHRHRQL